MSRVELVKFFGDMAAFVVGAMLGTLILGLSLLNCATLTPQSTTEIPDLPPLPAAPTVEGQIVPAEDKASPAPKPEVPPSVQYQSGIRPGCVPPPMTTNGIFRRWDESCMYDGQAGVATCVYMAKVALGTFWLCGLGMGQPNCAAHWEPLKLQCELWQSQFQTLLNSLTGANEEN